MLSKWSAQVPAAAGTALVTATMAAASADFRIARITLPPSRDHRIGSPLPATGADLPAYTAGAAREGSGMREIRRARGTW